MKASATSRLLAALACLALILPSLGSAARKDTELRSGLKNFNNIVVRLSESYVDSFPAKRTIDAAIDALLSELDPYTEYYDGEALKAFQTETTGEYAGIGSYIMQRDSVVIFSGPYEGSPAAKAGVRSGDRILRIDSVRTVGMPSDSVTRLLRGKPGTNVRVRVQRPYAGPDSIIDIDITRAKLQLPSVPYWGVTRSDIGYIKLNSFMETSASEVRKALEAFKADPRVKGVVLDLRGNGGGLLRSAVEIVGYFVPKGTEVLRTKGREPGDVKVYRTTHKPIMEDMPLAILIDGASASASEITAGALQDRDRAVLIGSRSFGKGLVQSTLPLGEDNMLKLTTAKYYIPSGRLIQALDYSRRNADGSVAPTPDSLCNTFKTLHGRPVKDGGGLKPDIEIDWGTPSRLVYNLVRDNWIFDYATRYAASHPTIPSAEEFVITDSIYADFKAGIDPKRLKYDKVCEDMLDQLEKVAKVEGYLNDSTTAEFAAMRRLLTHDLSRDLDTHRERIASYLASDIVGRYYYQKGEAIQNIKQDAALDSAANLLRHPAALQKLLRP